MSSLELEVKVLGINPEKLIEKINSLGGKFVSKEDQLLYTYNLPTIYGRFNNLLLQLNEPQNDVNYDTAIEELKLLFYEIDNLLDERLKDDLEKIIGKRNL